MELAAAERSKSCLGVRNRACLAKNIFIFFINLPMIDSAKDFEEQKR
jgi:hypothetical protein